MLLDSSQDDEERAMEALFAIGSLIAAGYPHKTVRKGPLVEIVIYNMAGEYLYSETFTTEGDEPAWWSARSLKPMGDSE